MAPGVVRLLKLLHDTIVRMFHSFFWAVVENVKGGSTYPSLPYSNLFVKLMWCYRLMYARMIYLTGFYMRWALTVNLVTRHRSGPPVYPTSPEAEPSITSGTRTRLGPTDTRPTDTTPTDTTPTDTRPTDTTPTDTKHRFDTDSR